MEKVTVIIPTYNEKENLSKLIDTLEKKIFPRVKKYQISILIVDDTSPDGTADMVSSLMKKWKNMYLSSGKKKGLGAAYLRGMSYAITHLQADIMLSMDADGQHNPEEILLLLEAISSADIVVGSRYIPGGSVPKAWGWKRRLTSYIANRFIGLTLRTQVVHDWTNSFRAIRKEVFLKEKKKLTAYQGSIFFLAFVYEAYKDGFSMKEIPIQLQIRDQGISKIIPNEYIKDILSYLMKQYKKS